MWNNFLQIPFQSLHRTGQLYTTTTRHYLQLWTYDASYWKIPIFVGIRDSATTYMQSLGKH